jgi:hypothetical protein
MDIATGPLHFDYNVSANYGFAGRIIFDIKMSQKIKFNLKAESLICFMSDNLNARWYFYNFNLIVYL